eukprot:NODE_2236_length_494_cov_576.206742_g1828_i0.p1 GENE.NODE_2236_length_494_cov_576.206742_g1828_i0~~NODE_2236_length_494_cov_576.206742_g1828_i0.p1  ORF type:complete len:97 (+),score=16.04 NODE_2236_length_494_cov_576.206742_g1828_i0:32-322(+)
MGFKEVRDVAQKRLMTKLAPIFKRAGINVKKYIGAGISRRKVFTQESERSAEEQEKRIALAYGLNPDECAEHRRSRADSAIFADVMQMRQPDADGT